MPKPAAMAVKRQPQATKISKDDDAKITATVAELDQLRPSTRKTKQLIALFKTWLADDSGYDEATLPALKSALNRSRTRVKARRLYRD